MAFGSVDDDAPLSRRRVWAVAPYVAFAIAGAAYLAGDALEGTAEMVVVVLFAVSAGVSSVAGYAVYSWQREWAHRPDEELDERERTARDGAYRSAYAILATVGALSLVGSQIALDVFDELSITEISSYAVIGWFLLALCLPSSVLLWREPDLDAAGADA
ncbi:MAG: hypothetical protein AB1Z57_06975 [Acidimicrobiia bacterium]